jgi:hypothetical protein
MLLIPQILLCGLVVSFSDLTPRSTTGNVPLIGDLIPSRWSYEALAVSSFTDNEYERQFFETDKGKYETQYYNIGLLDELQSQLETMKDEQRQGKKAKVDHMEVIRTNLPQLTAFCGLKPYQGDDSYESLNIYLKQAEAILAKRGNQFTLKGDALVSDYIRHNGKDAFLQLKRDNYNTKLEDCVIGADQRRMLDVVDNYVVPRMYSIYLTPQSQIGRAPFYSSEKILGTWHIKTLWFNMGVLLLMCIIMVILLTKNIIINIINNSNFKLK